MKKGDRVRIFHELDREGSHVIGRVTKVRQEISDPRGSWIEAEIEDSSHPLAALENGDKRPAIVVSPDLYEVISD
ncbi:MAG TPA: hypothetical protein VKW06_10430 [Candidatus Angelobacter sp.]|nr:hypothetical protein [Candidatus Angelobacter sp.]